MNESAQPVSESTPVRLSLVIAFSGVLLSVGGGLALAGDVRGRVVALEQDSKQDAVSRATLAAEVKALTKAVDRLEARLAKE